MGSVRLNLRFFQPNTTFSKLRNLHFPMIQSNPNQPMITLKPTQYVGIGLDCWFRVIFLGIIKNILIFF